jgi:hypothetical protein
VAGLASSTYAKSFRATWLEDKSKKNAEAADAAAAKAQVGDFCLGSSFLKGFSCLKLV